MLIWKVLQKPLPGNELICEKILGEIYTHELDIQIHNTVRYDIDSYILEIIESKKRRIVKLEQKYDSLCEFLNILEQPYIMNIPTECSYANSLNVVYKPEQLINYPNEWLNFWGKLGSSVKYVNF
jgi:hypothetical protein